MRLLLTIAALALLLGGCASKEAYEAYRASFDRAAEAYYLAAAEPLLSVELPSPVKDQPYKIVVNREVEPMNPQQIKNSEWAPVVQSGIGVVGTVGAAYVISNAVVDLASEIGDASGVHMTGENLHMTGTGNRSSAGDHGTASAGTRDSVDVNGEGNSGSMDRPSSMTTDDDVTTTVTSTSQDTTLEDVEY